MRLSKVIVFLFGLLILTASVFGQCQKSCGASSNECTKSHDDKAHGIGGKTAHVELPTIKCSMCQETIEKGLSKIDGILGIKIDVDKKMAMVSYDPAKIDEAKIEQAISSVGYQANKTAADPEAYKKLAACCKHDKKS